MTVTETLLKGEHLWATSHDEFYSTTFYHRPLELRLSLQDNSFLESEKIDYVIVSFYSRAVNKQKRLRVYESSKGLYFKAYGKRIYLDELVKY